MPGDDAVTNFVRLDPAEFEFWLGLVDQNLFAIRQKQRPQIVLANCVAQKRGPVDDLLSAHLQFVQDLGQQAIVGRAVVVQIELKDVAHCRQVDYSSWVAYVAMNLGNEAIDVLGGARIDRDTLHSVRLVFLGQYRDQRTHAFVVRIGGFHRARTRSKFQCHARRVRTGVGFAVSG